MNIETRRMIYGMFLVIFGLYYTHKNASYGIDLLSIISLIFNGFLVVRGILMIEKTIE